MAAGLPKTRQQVEALFFPPLQSGKPRVLVRLPSWKRGHWRLLCSVSLISLCSFVVYQQLGSSIPLAIRDPSDFPTASLVAAPGADSHSATLILTTSKIAKRASSGVNIVCLGDSLTQGVGASRDHDYPSLLSQVLGTTVINAGVDGDETVDALKRLESDVLAKDPRMVIVELGANDLLDGQPLEQAFKNLDEIVRRIDERGAMVVLVEMATGPLGDALQPCYDTIIHKYHVAFVPKVLEGILMNPALQSSDHLHPNDRGYALIAERIQGVVIPLLHGPEAFGRPPQQQ